MDYILRSEDLVNNSEEKIVAWDKYTDKPSRFIALLSACSNDQTADIKEVMQEWEYSNETCVGPGFCICSQPGIVHHHFMRNIITGRVAAIGSECIKKFGTNIQNEQLSILVRRRMYKGINSQCCSCGMNTVYSGDSFAVPLCNLCIQDKIRTPSKNYLAAYGARCVSCKKNQVLHNSLITCCDQCGDIDCCRCGIRFLRGDNMEEACPYCDKSDIDEGIFCDTCKIRLNTECRNRGDTTCNDCELEITLKRERAKKASIQARKMKPKIVFVASKHCSSCDKELDTTWRSSKCWTCIQSNKKRFCTSCNQQLPSSRRSDKCHSCFQQLPKRACTSCNLLKVRMDSIFKTCYTCSPK